MEPKKNKLELEILHIHITPKLDMVLIVGKLLTGDIYGIGEGVTDFRCLETGGRWKLAGIAILGAREIATDIRTLGFEHFEGSEELEPGFTLVSEEV